MNAARQEVVQLVRPHDSDAGERAGEPVGEGDIRPRATRVERGPERHHLRRQHQGIDLDRLLRVDLDRRDRVADRAGQRRAGHARDGEARVVDRQRGIVLEPPEVEIRATALEAQAVVHQAVSEHRLTPERVPEVGAHRGEGRLLHHHHRLLGDEVVLPAVHEGPARGERLDLARAARPELSLAARALVGELVHLKARRQRRGLLELPAVLLGLDLRDHAPHQRGQVRVGGGGPSARVEAVRPDPVAHVGDHVAVQGVLHVAPVLAERLLVGVVVGGVRARREVRRLVGAGPRLAHGGEGEELEGPRVEAAAGRAVIPAAVESQDRHWYSVRRLPRG